MVRRIRWTSRADSIFTEILEFYCNHIKSKSYSRKLTGEIDETLNLIAIYPFLGMSSDIKNTRVMINGHFKIFYKIETDEIIVLLETRQYPKTCR